MSCSWRFSLAELPEAFPDLTPVAIGGEADGLVAAIDYSEAFVTAFGYMRAVLQQNEQEFSERTLKLTATCLQLNPANYTVWHFRRLCLDRLVIEDEDHNDFANIRDAYIAADLELAASLGGDNPKNYQIWYHRRALLEKVLLQSKDDFAEKYGTAELEYLGKVLAVDAKNYHAWSHRQWVIQALATWDSSSSSDTISDASSVSIWKTEMEYCETLIQADIRNNSAWNYRWFVAHRGGGRKLLAQQSHQQDDTDAASISILSADTAQIEMDYAIAIARMDVYNESPWRYLIGILKEQILHLQDAAQVVHLLDASLQTIAEVEQDHQVTLAEEEETDDDNNCCSRHLLAAKIDILQWKSDPESLRQAIAYAEALATQHDTIRRKYWQYRIRGFEQSLNSGNDNDNN